MDIQTCLLLSKPEYKNYQSPNKRVAPYSITRPPTREWLHT